MQRLILAWLLGFHAFLGQCEEDKIKFTYQSDGFSISLLEDWKEIPKDVLDEYSKLVSIMMTEGQNQTYQYGYQPAANGEWLTYPYALIQVKNIGRVPESVLKKMTVVDLSKGAAKALKGLEEVLSQSSFEKPVYDPQTHIMWVTGAMNVAGIGMVKVVGGMHLTEKGSINVWCYSKEEEFDSHASLFREIVNSVELSDALKYKPGFSLSTPANWNIGSGIMAGAIRGAIIGGLVGLGFALYKKFKNRS